MAAGGRPSKGARSQFRLGTGGFFQGVYPVHRDIMDIGQSSQTGFSTEYLSSNIGTKTRTVREYEQTISELKKENFDLKLRVFFFEESSKKSASKDKENCSPKEDNNVEVIVQLKLETESLKNQLSYKEKQLQDAIHLAEKCASENIELSKKIKELQSELDSLAELPSKEEYALLRLQNENLLKQINRLERILIEKDEEIRMCHEKVDHLCKVQTDLEEKKKKCDFFITTFVKKRQEDKENLPDAVRTIVESAVQAARNQKKDDLRMAVKNFTTAISQIMHNPNPTSLNKLVEEEIVESSQSQCLKENNVGRRKSNYHSSSSQANSGSSEHSVEALSEIYTPQLPKDHNLEAFTQSPNLRDTPLSENFSNKDIVDFVTCSDATEEAAPNSLPKLSEDNQQISFVDINALKIEYVDASPSTTQDVKSSMNQALLNVLKENELLKQELEKNLALVKDLKSVCKRLKSQMLDGKQDDALEISSLINVESTQSSHTLPQLDEKMSGQLSDDTTGQLREENLFLTLTIEEKEKQLEDMRQALKSVQADLNEALSGQNPLLSEEAMNVKNELLERLAYSSQVTDELMRYLHNLEKFMEDLLQHKMDDSSVDVSEQSSFLSHVSRCLNQSVKLSNVLSDHLSICERSKFFDECSRTSLRNNSEDRSFPTLDVSESSFAEYLASIQQQKGMEKESEEQTKQMDESSELEKYKEEIKNLKEEKNSNNAKLKNAEQNIFSLERKIYQMQVTLDANEKDQSAMCIRIERLQCDKENLSKKCSDLQTELDDSHNQQSDLQSKWDICKENVMRQKDSLDASKKELEFLKQTIENLQYTKMSLSTKCSELQSALENAKSRQSDLEKQCDIYKVEALNKTNSFDANKKELESCKKTIENLQTEKDSISTMCSKLECMLKDARTEYPNLQIQSVYLEDGKNEDSSDVHKMKFESLHERMEILKKEKDSLSAQVRKLQSALENAKSEYPDFQNQSADYKKIKSKSIILDANNKEIESLYEEIKKLQTEKYSLSVKCIELQSALKNAESKQYDVENQCQIYKEEIRNKKVLLHGNEKEFEFLKGRLEILQTEKVSLSSLCSQLQSTLKNAENKVTEFENQCGIFKKDAVNKKDLSDANKKKLESLSGRIETLLSEPLSTKYSELQSAIDNNQHEYPNHKEVKNKSISLDDNEKELKSLHEKIEKLQCDKKFLSDKCSELQLALENAEHKQSAFESQCEFYKEDAIHKNGLLDANIKEIEFLIERIETLQSEKASLFSKYSELESALENAESKKPDSEKQTFNKRDVHASANECENLNERIKILQIEKDSLFAQCKELQLALKNSQSEYSDPQNHSADYNQDKNKSISLNINKKEIESLNGRIETLQIEKDSLLDKCNDLQSALETEKCKQSGFENQCKIYKEEIMDKKDLFDANKKELESLNYKIETLQIEKDTLFTKFCNLQSAIENIQSEYPDLQKQLSDYNEDKNKSTFLYGNKNELQSLNEMVETLQSEKDSLSSKCNELQSAVELSESKQSDFENQCKVFESVVDANKKEFEYLYESIKTLQNEKDSICAKCHELQSALKNTQIKYPDNQTHSAENKEVKNKDFTLVDNKKELDFLNEKIKTLQIEKDSLTTKVSELQMELERNCSEYSNLKNQCDHYKNESFNKSNSLDALKKELKSLNKSIEILQLSAESSSAKCSELESALENARKQQSDLQNECNIYAKEVVTKRDSLNASTKERATLNQRIEKLQHNEKVLFNKCTELELELSNAQNQYFDLQNQCDRYKKEVVVKKDSLKFNQKELASLNQRIEILQHSEKSLSALCKKLQSASENFEYLKTELQKQCVQYKEEVANKNDMLDANGKKLESLHERLESLECSENTLSAKCADLQLALENSKKNSSDLEKQRDFYKKEGLKPNHKFHTQQLQLKQNLEREKEILSAEISSVCSQQEDNLQQLKLEKEKVKKLKEEKAEANDKIALLRHANNELEMNCKSIADEKVSIQSSLLASESKYAALGAEFAQMQENLQNLQSKCKIYKKDLQTLTQQKLSLTNSALSAKKKLSTTKAEIQKTCVLYDVKLSIESDKVILSLDVDDGASLCEALSSESEQLSKMVSMLLNAFKDSQIKSEEIQSDYDKNVIKLGSIKKQIDLLKSEVEHVHKHNEILKRMIEEKQKMLSDFEKSVKSSNSENLMLKEKLQSAVNEIEKKTDAIKIKDDELTMLQERIFNLQTDMNGILDEKAKSMEKTSESFVKDWCDKSADSTTPYNSFSSISANDEHDSDENLLSSASHPKNSCCEIYWRKCRFLKRKLALCQNHVRILEQQKEGLRMFQSSNSNLEESKAASDKICDLQSKLEQKKNFISELKEELLKACNSLIDREREVDSLRTELINAKELSDKLYSATNVDCRMDTNIKIARNNKWMLMQKIFDIQKDFYEQKGIHQSYLHKFRERIKGMYVLFNEHAPTKSESLPLLDSQSRMHDQSYDKNKCLMNLELDVECLENLKIFLTRYFAVCASSDFTSKSTHSIQASEDSFSSVAKKPQDSNLGILEIFSRKLKINILQENFSVDNFVLNVSKHVDVLEGLFRLAEKFEEFPNVTVTETKEEELLVIKMMEELKRLRSRADNLINLNLALKNLDTFPSKTDISDQESLLSEETLVISECETLPNHETANSSKLPPSVMLDGHLSKPKSISGLSYIDGPTCLKTVTSSWDFMHQRSQYSSPDLGIESDPNHEICCAPNHREYQESPQDEQVLDAKDHTEVVSSSSERNKQCKAPKGPYTKNNLYAICNLSSYELLKREVQESLVGIKSVLSRTGDGLHHIGRHTSPRKTLEYATLRAIKDTCGNIEVCLKEAYAVIGKFWVGHCPSEQEWNELIQENQSLVKQLSQLTALMKIRESEFNSAMRKLEHAELLKAATEKKISKKLVKTKKVLRQAELKILEKQCQNSPPVPKFPSQQ